MIKVTWDDYKFEIDIEKTKKFYSDTQKVFPNLSENLPNLTYFLASLGIDIEKPVKYDVNDASDLLYWTFGEFTTKAGYELDFYEENKYVSVVFHACENRVDVEVFGIQV